MGIYDEFKFVVELDLDNSGSFATDISSFLLAVEDLSEGRRTLAEAFGPPTANLILDNDDGRFSSRNTSSPYSPDFKRWKPVRVRAQMTSLPAVTNISDNPSAETDVVGWGTAASATIVQGLTEAHYGKASVKVTTANLDGSGVLHRPRGGGDFGIVASTSYTWKFRVKGLAGKVLRVQMTWGGVRAGPVTLITLTGEWQTVLKTDASEVGETTVRMALVTDGAIGVFDFNIDGSFLYLGTVDEPYCDGDQPGCSWSGTVHESTSSRPANPFFGYLLGRIEDIDLRRDDQLRAICALRLKSESGLWGRKPINMAYISDKKGHLAVERVLDKIEGDVGIQESAFQDFGVGTLEFNLWTAIAGATKSRIYQAVPTTTFEGSHRLLTTTLDGTGRGVQRDMTSLTINERNYDVVIYSLRGGTTFSNPVRLRISDQTGEISGVDYTISGIYQRVVLASVQWPATSTSRFVEVVTTGVEIAGAEINIDAWQIQETTKKLARRMDGTTYDVHFAGAFQRSARALLNELAASAGGWVREEMDDSPATSRTVVFEDIGNRASSPIPKLRLSDSLDGIPYDAGSLAYGERGQDNYSIIRVGSLGDIRRQGSSGNLMEMWRLEPANVVFAAAQTKRLFINPYTIGGIANDTTEAFDAGGGSTLGFDYTIGGFLDVTKDATPGTLTTLLVEGVLLERSTERSFTEVDKRPDVDKEPARVLEVEMLGQGRLTQAMDDVRDFYGNRFYHGLPHMEVDVAVADEEQLLAVLGRKLGSSVRLKHKLGQGNYALDDDFYLEGRQLAFRTGEVLHATLFLSPA